jgi:hypothetical protein
MGSPENESDRETSEGPQHEVTLAQPLAVSEFEVTSKNGMLALPQLGARESQTVALAERLRRAGISTEMFLAGALALSMAAQLALLHGFLCDDTSIDEAHVGKAEQDCEASDKQPAALCPCQGRALWEMSTVMTTLLPSNPTWR